MIDFLENYKKKLITQYPAVADQPGLSYFLEYFISDFVIELPKSVLTRAQCGIKKIANHAHSKGRVAGIRENLKASDVAILDSSKTVKNSSVLMAYDFHYEAASDCVSLIEINTNGAAFLLAELLYRSQPSEQSTDWPQALERLKYSFENECLLMNLASTPHIQIMDETPLEQKMYIEFLMYQDFFKSFNWPSQIGGPDEAMRLIAAEKINFIYNRYTDFKFSNTTSQGLLASYLNGQIIFSPHPREYLLLAEKSNLIEFARDQVSEILIPAFDLNNHKDPDSVWANRKQYVFKPKSSHGSKGVYKGSSISRKTFSEILKQDFIAQEFRAPGSFGPWKYDIRFYVYQDEIQLGVARVYQGQVTNFRTPGGGLARLRFV